MGEIIIQIYKLLIMRMKLMQLLEVIMGMKYYYCLNYLDCLRVFHQQ